jgi:hypothetical protein
VTATVTNAGPRSTGNPSLLRVVDRVGSTTMATKYITTPVIPPHSSVELSVRLILGPAHCGESHQLVVTADFSGLIDEFNEDDNPRYLTYMLEH